MLISEIETRLRSIADCSGDDEMAHGMEDALYKDFIRSVAQGGHDPELQRKANLVLSAESIDFERWCA